MVDDLIIVQRGIIQLFGETADEPTQLAFGVR